MWLGDLLARYVISLGSYFPVLLVSVVVIGTLAVRPTSLEHERWRLRLIFALAGLAIGWAAYLSWIGDDAYISFRYARNLVEGHGLVFNIGERVEGYTNFLWTVAIAGALSLGLDAGQSAVVLSIACFLAVIVLSTRLRSPPPSSPAVTIAAIVLAANYAFASYATSGLETMFGTLLVLSAFLAARDNRLLLAGALGSAAIMAHPDHAIFFAGLGITLAMRRRGVGPLVRYALPFVFVFLPYYAWRTYYYGDLYPNTYYAKSGDLWYVGQGLRYLAINVLALGLVLCLPLALVQAFRQRRTWAGSYVLIVVPIYFVYLLKIGGDFMLGRLLVPVFPFLVVLAESAIIDARESGRRSELALAVLALSLATVPNGVVRYGEIYHGVADERTFYRLVSFAPIRINNGLYSLAHSLRDVFADATRPPRLATGNVGILGYYTNFPISDDFGLTDPVVAHAELAKRGRVGHEKLSSAGHVVSEDADLAVVRVYTAPFHKLTRVSIADADYSFAKYDRVFVDSWKAHPEVRLVDFPQRLDRFRVSAKRNQRECQHWFLEQYYFSHNRDPQRLERLRALFVAREPSWQSLEDFVLDGDPDSGRWTAIPVESFDEGQLNWVSEGTAFSTTDRKAPRQAFIHGHTARFVSSYTVEDGDAAVGELVSSPFTIEGDAITFRLAGGKSPNTRVELIHDGEVVHRSSGCRSEILSRRIWNVAPYRGEEVQIRLVDAATSRWDHLVVDTIIQWRRN